MPAPQPLPDALAALRITLLDPERLVRAIASGRRGGHPAHRRADLQPVDLAAGRLLQVVRYDERQAFTANHPYGPDAEAQVDALLAEPYGHWRVEALDGVVELRVTKRGLAQVHRSAPAAAASADGPRAHDRAKPRAVDPGEPYLQAVGITDAEGRVRPRREGKYAQVEAFVRALEPVLDPLAALDRAGPLAAVDLGCGNAYLTFAAYDRLRARGLDVRMTGVDVKAQARERNTRIAAELGWPGLAFAEGTIAGADVGPADLVLALHACDTATDEALARAVRWGSRVVLAAPCCHHDVQRQLRQAEPPYPYGPLVRHGILRERFADALTDALRACLLRLLGYRVEVVEFVGSQHTPRNTLIRAVRTGAPATAEQAAEYRDLRDAWGVVPALERMLPHEVARALA